MANSSIPLTARHARAIWLRAQRLDIAAPFGEGPDAVRLATGHLGYVQIDTINVIERSHHHILQTRIPTYRRADLEQAQSGTKSVFEYWTHALAYVPTADYRMFLPAMNQFRADPHPSYADLDAGHYAALLKRIRDEGALSIRDINDEVLVEKTHPWGSRKPSRRALRYGFFSGDLAVSKRTGMLKSYDLSARHFGWPRRPRPATVQQVAQYLLARALRCQGMVSLDSVCFGNMGAKAAIRTLIDAAVAKKQLVPVHIDNHANIQHWVAPAALEHDLAPLFPTRTAILSPFDPLIIQRKRLQLFFGYEHRFEAYVPADKRVLGYFALPVLAGDEIVAALDLKMDRSAGMLAVQKWTWFTAPRPELQTAIDEALDRFERFQKG